jgi:tetratricopeptide (TPR) repeat protein
VRARLELLSDRPADAATTYAAARDLYAELGNTRNEAVMTMMMGCSAYALGELERAEKHLRDAVRTLKGLGDRGSLVEAQRALSMVLVERGKLEEAERFALEARMTVGPEDRVSVSTTKLALGLVRAAQRRDDEAEKLMVEAVEGLAMYDLRSPERLALRQLVEFLRDRGRDDEAAIYEERLAALLPSSTAAIA